jgi:hypothetical protein
MLTACGQAPQTVSEALSEVCAEAHATLASAPTPTHPNAQMAFRRAAEEATQLVGDVTDELAVRGDDQTIADLAWQLHRFPSIREDEPLRAAHEASAAIVRIDRFARTLEVPDCGAATWRPVDWQAFADRLAARPSDSAFRQTINRLCDDTFPNPSLLRTGVPLLAALAAEPSATAATIDVEENVKSRLLPRLRTVSGRPGDTRRFLTRFANGVTELQPSDELREEHLALVVAFMGLDATVPRGMPRDPPPAVRERVGAALEELEAAWEELDITC